MSAKKKTLAAMKKEAFEIALDLPDEGSVEIMRVAKRQFKMVVNQDDRYTPGDCVWTRSGAHARTERDILAKLARKQDLTKVNVL